MYVYLEIAVWAVKVCTMANFLLTVRRHHIRRARRRRPSERHQLLQLDATGPADWIPDAVYIDCIARLTKRGCKPLRIDTHAVTIRSCAILGLGVE